MRNLSRITNYWNRVEAWKDWNKIAAFASLAGYASEVEKLKPPDNASWRKIDKAIDRLRGLMNRVEVEK